MAWVRRQDCEKLWTAYCRIWQRNIALRAQLARQGELTARKRHRKVAQ